MLDLYHLPSSTGAADVQILVGAAATAGQDWITWRKPRGKTMIDILLIGRAGNGGNGAVGANSTAAGGGGGGSGSQTRVTMPLALLPDILYISLAGQSTSSTAQASFVSIQPKMTAGAGACAANDAISTVNGGSVGGNAAGATAGSAGTAGGAVSASSMPLGFAYAQVFAETAPPAVPAEPAVAPAALPPTEPPLTVEIASLAAQAPAPAVIFG